MRLTAEATAVAGGAVEARPDGAGADRAGADGARVDEGGEAEEAGGRCVESGTIKVLHRVAGAPGWQPLNLQNWPTWPVWPHL